MRLFFDTVLKYRSPILIFLIFTQLVFSSTAYFDDVDDNLFLLNTKSILSILIILLALTFLDKLNLYQFLANKREVIQDLSPARYIYYDCSSKEVIMPNLTRAALYLENKKTYSLNDISKLFPLADWDEISKYIDNPMSYLNIEKIGMIEINITKDDKLYFKYSLQSVRDRDYELYGVILWFVDFTQTRLAEIELISLLKKYREMSFELDSLFDNLSIPLWKCDSNGEIVLHNKAFEKIKNHSDSSLIDLIKRGSETGFTKKILIKNHSYTYKFQELKLSSNDQRIGYAIDISDSNLIKKNAKSLQNTIDTVLELSSNATLVIDNKRKIVQFNSSFVNLFDLDRTWLSQNITYFSLLDKLKEQGKLEEIADYKDYKNSQINFLNNLKEPHHALQHLPDGRTLRVSTVPTDIGNIIFIYDNVTDLLHIERSYNELMETFRSLLVELNEAVCIVDHIGKIRISNQMFAKLFMNSESELPLNYTFSELLDKTTNAVLQNNKKIIEEELAIAHDYRKSECRVISHDASSLKFSVSPLPDNGTLIVFHL